MKSFKNILKIILNISPVVITAVIYNKLPDMIPVQWQIGGNVAYGDKSMIWMFSGISLLFLVFFELLPKIDPRKKNYSRFKKYYDEFCFFFLGFMLTIYLVVVSESFYPGKIEVYMVISFLIGLLFVFLGNMLPKIKSNFFMGIKTPWTLSDEDIWNKTHRLGGMLFFVLGIILMAGAFALKEAVLFYVTIALTVIVAAVPFLMSYIWYKEKHKGDIEN